MARRSRRSRRSRANRLGRTGRRAVDIAEHSEDFADLMRLLDRVPQRQVGANTVPITSPVARPFEITGFDEFGDQSLGGAFGDADQHGQVPDPNSRVPGNAVQHVGMVGEERPIRHAPC